MADKQTLEVYDAQADHYASAFGGQDKRPISLEAFIAAMPKGGRVLDLGCGPGSWARHMADAGLQVDATDASAEMVKTAAALPGVTAWQAVFEDLEAEALYNGVWANFSLLHAPKEDMPAHLTRIWRALKPSGVFHIGLKMGEGSARDSIGRYYSYYQPEELRGLLEQAGFIPGEMRQGADKGLDGVVAPWMTWAAVKGA